MGCPFIGVRDSLDDHLSKCGYEAIKGFFTQNERHVQELEEQLQQERKDNAVLRETITQLLSRVSAIETKNSMTSSARLHILFYIVNSEQFSHLAHYDSVIVRWNQGQIQIAKSPIRPLLARPVITDGS